MVRSRPGCLVVIAGTATEIGKTWVGVELAAALRGRSVSVQARKPAQSFAAAEPAERTDAGLLGEATDAAPSSVCPQNRWYPLEMAPPMAADALGREPLRLDVLIAEIERSWGDAPADVGMVELAGGVWSPIAHDGDCLDLTRALGPDLIVLVTDAGLGTISTTRPAVAALAPIAPVVTLLNRFDPAQELHRRNLEWLRDRDAMTLAIHVDTLADTLLR